MEGRGLVVREPSPADGRGSAVVLTAVGSSQFRRASAAHLRAVQQLFVEAFSGQPGGLDAVEAVTAALRTHLDSPGR
jgi:DNA-binding MarR family transcriptional regulator